MDHNSNQFLHLRFYIMWARTTESDFVPYILMLCRISVYGCVQLNQIHNYQSAISHFCEFVRHDVSHTFNVRYSVRNKNNGQMKLMSHKIRSMLPCLLFPRNVICWYGCIILSGSRDVKNSKHKASVYTNQRKSKNSANTIWRSCPNCWLINHSSLATNQPP